jgi:hypothetical protein
LVSNFETVAAGTNCPDKSAITFVSEVCRYDITLPIMTPASSWWGGGGGWGGWLWATTSTTTNTGTVVSTSTWVVSNTWTTATPSNPTATTTIGSDISTLDTKEIPKSDFKDIGTSFAKPDIDFLVSKWVIKWFADGTFKPNNSASRAEFLAMVMKALKTDLTSNQQLDFKDLPKAWENWDWMNKYVAKAKDFWIKWQNIDGDKVFRPNDSITRAEAIAILLKISDITTVSASSTSFTDVKAKWIIPYVEKAKELWISKGQTIDWKLKFRPDDSITRAETARMIIKVLLYKNANK